MVFGVFSHYYIGLKKPEKSAKNPYNYFWLYGFGPISKIYHIHIEKCRNKRYVRNSSHPTENRPALSTLVHLNNINNLMSNEI